MNEKMNVIIGCLNNVRGKNFSSNPKHIFTWILTITCLDQ